MWLSLLPLSLLTGVAIVSRWKEQGAEHVSYGHMSLVPSVTGGPPQSGIPEGRDVLLPFRLG